MKIFYGEESYLINQEVVKFGKTIGVKPTVFSEEEPLANIILDITTVSMFFDKKIVVIKNHEVITDREKGKNFLNEVGELDESVHVIFVLEQNKLPKSTIVEYIAQKGETKEFKRLSDNNIVPTIKDIVQAKGGTITNGAAIRLASKVPNDLRTIVNEVEKLVNQNSEINEEMIETSIGDYVKEDSFALANALTNGDTHEILRAYSERKKALEEPTFLIGQISSVLSLALQVNSLRRQGLTNQDISDKTKIHIFRIKKASDLIARNSIEKIKDLVIKLAELDADIKTGKIEDQMGLDNFILEVVR